VLQTDTRDLLFEIEILEFAQALLFRLPDAIDNILNAQHEVCLTVSCVAEGHIWWISLGNGRQSQMRRPSLDHDHVACNEASSVSPAS